MGQSYRENQQKSQLHLGRNLRHVPSHCRKSAYIALVRSSLEYGSVVWDPHLQQDIDKLEKVQRKAARFIKKDFKSRHTGAVTDMLNDLDLPSLEQRRRDNRLFHVQDFEGASAGHPIYWVPHQNQSKKDSKSKS